MSNRSLHIVQRVTKPYLTKYDQKKKVYTAKFIKEICGICPFQDRCPINEQKKYNTVRFTESHSDAFRSSMNSERHKELSKFRAGVEGVVSALRRKLGVNDLPVLSVLKIMDTRQNCSLQLQNGNEIPSESGLIAYFL